MNLRRRHPLRVLLTGWERVRSTRGIDLGSLDRDEVADQLTGILGAAPEPDLADLIFDRSGGNPIAAMAARPESQAPPSRQHATA
jgi:hypothetical protein